MQIDEDEDEGGYIAEVGGPAIAVPDALKQRDGVRQRAAPEPAGEARAGSAAIGSEKPEKPIIG